MPRKRKPIVGEEENRLIRNAVRRANYHIMKEAEKNPHLSGFLPEKQKVKEVKQRIGSKSDLQREVRTLSGLAKADLSQLHTHETGFTRTAWEVKDRKERLRIENIKLASERKKAEKIARAGLGVTMGNEQLKKFEKKSYEPPKNLEEWKRAGAVTNKRIKSTYHKEQDDEYKKRYLKALHKQFGNTKRGKIIKDIVKKMDASQIAEASKISPFLEIAFIYPDETTDIDTIYDIATDEWRKLSQVNFKKGK